MSDTVTIVHCFVIFTFLVIFFTIYLCQFELLQVLLSKQENSLLLIKLKYKLLHYNKVTSICHWVTLLYNNGIFYKNDFLNLEILLKDISDISLVYNLVLLIHCTIEFLSLNLFCKRSEQYYDKTENNLENHYFRYLSKKMLMSSNFQQHLGPKEYVIEFTIG